MRYDQGPCTVKFYASLNFEGFKVHDARPKRFYYLVREGPNAAVYSVESAAVSAAPPGKYIILRCRTITEAVHHWKEWCRSKHGVDHGGLWDAKKIAPFLGYADDDSNPLSESEDEAPIVNSSSPCCCECAGQLWEEAQSTVPIHPSNRCPHRKEAGPRRRQHSHHSEEDTYPQHAP
ncbi:hypothetical protein MSAN_00963400 [Mycena sanguinolenta]|uniref:Uncharacterized protein n=1 Tax=Mycena sanguinolenta TaxID=230812 RepID=A0A8H6YY14_9AGAR|nr:hypothetical protein MSAN_00963400 [Mycena sanguinolenta]